MSVGSIRIFGEHPPVLGGHRIGLAAAAEQGLFWRLKKPPSCFSREIIWCGWRKLQSLSTITCSRS
jgi:hypothetical protein